MDELSTVLERILRETLLKIVISKPSPKTYKYRKIIATKKEGYYQFERFTETQVFHENIKSDHLAEKCKDVISEGFRQLNAWTLDTEYSVTISKRGRVFFDSRAAINSAPKIRIEHNRRKKYILQDGQYIAPLVDMGVLTEDGKVISSMQGKYRQINRFLEILDDEINDIENINVIDFGCGKSYLTFIVYYYLTKIRKISVNMIGVDLKSDVIESCNRVAKKYGYSSLHFEIGDICEYSPPFNVDLVVSLHACDTATDYALFNAVQWGAKMVFSVPCCQHEINRQLRPTHYSIFARHGIVKERFSALITDAIRSNLLECCGYKTQLLEFVDFEHTPKNLLIRAVLNPSITIKARKKALAEVEELIKEFGISPKFYVLLNESRFFRPIIELE